MAENKCSKTLEEMKAQFIEIPTSKDSNAESKKFASKLLMNNYKLCLFTELFKERAEKLKFKDENHPTLSMLENAKTSLEQITNILSRVKAENKVLINELQESKLKLIEKIFYDKNRDFYDQYRKNIFPMLMKNFEKKEALINDIFNNSDENPSEDEFNLVTYELENAIKDNQHLKKTEDEVIEIRRQNEVIEVETCRIQVHSMEMDTEIQSFDEFAIENQIAELQQKIINAKTNKLKKQQENDENNFKNPNDFPTLLDFLVKCKKYKQKKRKNSSQSRQPSKRRKNKTGSYSQHDKNGNQTKVQPIKNHQSSGNLNPPSNEHGNMLQRTYSSKNLSNVNSSSNRLMRQKSVSQLEPSTSVLPPQMPKGRKLLSQINNNIPTSSKRNRQEAFETDEDGHLLLQHFPCKPLFPEEPPKSVHKKSTVSSIHNKQPEKTIKTRSATLLTKEVIVQQSQVTTEERTLRSKAKVKSPKKSEKVDKNKVKSPKKDVKKRRGRKKTVKTIDSDLMLPDNNENLKVNNISMTSNDSADKLMAADEIQVAESFNSNVAVNENLLTKSPINNKKMDMDESGSSTNANGISKNLGCFGNAGINIKNFDMDIDCTDKNKAGDEESDMSNSFEQIFCNSPTWTGNLEFIQSFE